MEGIRVHLHRCFTVFQRITLGNGFERQLAFFADGYEADIQLISQGRADDKAACVQTGHNVDFLIHITVNQQIHQQAEILRALQDGRNVVKQNAFLGPVGNFPHFFKQGFHAHYFGMNQHRRILMAEIKNAHCNKFSIPQRDAL